MGMPARAPKGFEVSLSAASWSGAQDTLHLVATLTHVPDGVPDWKPVAGDITHVQFGFPDFDGEPKRLKGFESLSGANDFRWRATHFVDAVLMGCGDCGSAVRPDAWARIKAGLR